MLSIAAHKMVSCANWRINTTAEQEFDVTLSIAANPFFSIRNIVHKSASIGCHAKSNSFRTIGRIALKGAL